MRNGLLLSTLVATAVHVAPAQNLGTRVDAYLKGRPVPGFSGVITVARNNVVILNRAYGLADADLEVPNRTDLRFGLGSLTKPITATAALRLVERGQLHLGDSICAYLRQCP